MAVQTLPKAIEFRRTKIVATIGPATESLAVLSSAISAGVDVVRLNFSHGSHDEKASVIRLVREIASEMGKTVTILQDLQGPKIRIGEIEAEPVELHEGQAFTIFCDGRPGNEKEASISYPDLAAEIAAGDPIFLDDGMIELRVQSISGGRIETQVVHGGHLSSRKGVNLPGVKLSATSLTEKDEADLRFGLEAGIDMVALSFVRRPEDALRARAIMSAMNCQRPLIAKIEKAEALDAIDDILDTFDGVMVARGDLGVEIGTEKVPSAQKRIIRRANAAGKPVITATQMLESMTYAPTPTRAEASDVANAVLDGTDAVMLSGETAVGAFPVKTVETMDRIVREAEKQLGSSSKVATGSDWTTPFFCSAAVHLARDLGAAGIAALTINGRTAEILSKLHPTMPVFALSNQEALAARLNLWRGIIPLVIDDTPAIEEASLTIGRELRERGLLPSGSRVVIVGVSPGQAGSGEPITDFIRLITT